VQGQDKVRADIVAKLKWADGKGVDHLPPSQLAAEGGDGGEPGEGGAGLAGDPFGVCQAGLSGATVHSGDPAREERRDL
jgi:hypothetical protein